MGQYKSPMSTFSIKFKQALQHILKHPMTALTVAGYLTLIVFLQYASRHVFVDADAFYHGRMASLTQLWHSISEFRWLQNTTLLKDFADQQYLFHILLKPFNSPTKLHIATALCASINILAFLYTLHRFKISWKPAWLTLYVVGSATFLLRLNLVKAVPIFSALLLITLCVLLQKHVWPLICLGLVGVLLYGGFVLLPLFTALHAIVVYVYTKKLDYKPLLFLCIGMSFGFILHPYHAALPRFLWQQIIESGLQSHSSVQQGYEWLPYRLHDGVQDILLFIPWSLAVYGAIKALLHKKLEPYIATTICWLGILSIGTFLVMLKSGRYIEYWVPLALLFSGVVYSTLYGKVLNKISVRSVLHLPVYKKILYGCMGIGAIALLARNITLSFLMLEHGTPTEEFRPAAEWLIRNTPKGTTVWNTQWDEFPQLFYWNTHNTYIVGLDPVFMYLQNQEEYGFYKMVSNDIVPAAPILHTTLTAFYADYIFLENKRNPKLKKILDQSDEHFHLSYTDTTTSVYTIR